VSSCKGVFLPVLQPVSLAQQFVNGTHRLRGRSAFRELDGNIVHQPRIGATDPNELTPCCGQWHQRYIILVIPPHALALTIEQPDDGEWYVSDTYVGTHRVGLSE
jgi:hypothetical protein